VVDSRTLLLLNSTSCSERSGATCTRWSPQKTTSR